MRLFWVDEKHAIKKTYDDLLADINGLLLNYRVISDPNPYTIFLNILVNMLDNVDCELVDYDLSIEELSALDISKSAAPRIPRFILKTYDELCERLNVSYNETNIVFYTSGTTGKPKKIGHKLSNITRNVKMSERNKNCVWGFAFNPTHFAGIQVFWQAFLNNNCLVNLFDADCKSINQIFSEYQITNISATPTFYRLMAPYIKEHINSVQTATFGGERHDYIVKNILMKIFPNAKIRNIYASTELGALFSSNNDIFTIHDSIKDKVRIAGNNELLVCSKLLGRIDNDNITDGWYATGDIIEFVSDNKFRIVSRVDGMVNVGGYKVNIEEVEDIIKSLECVKDATVYARANSVVGNILLADIVLNFGYESIKVKNIKEWLKARLQEWKVPQMIRMVDNVEMTKSGKKVRK